MRKLYFTFAFLFVCFFAIAQEAALPDLKVDEKAKDILYAGTVPVSGASQEVLYTLAKAWLVDQFKVEDPKIKPEKRETGFKADNKQEGTLSGKTFSMISSSQTYKLYYTIYFTLKDGEYSYKITDFLYRGAGDDRAVSAYYVMHVFLKKKNGNAVKWRQDARQAAAVQMEKVVADLQKSMSKAENRS